MFNRLLKKINKVKSLEFDKATEELEDFVYNNSNFLDILGEIGAIPESKEAILRMCLQNRNFMDIRLSLTLNLLE